MEIDEKKIHLDIFPLGEISILMNELIMLIHNDVNKDVALCIQSNWL